MEEEQKRSGRRAEAKWKKSEAEDRESEAQKSAKDQVSFVRSGVKPQFRSFKFVRPILMSRLFASAFRILPVGMSPSGFVVCFPSGPLALATLLLCIDSACLAAGFGFWILIHVNERNLLSFVRQV